MRLTLPALGLLLLLVFAACGPEMSAGPESAPDTPTTTAMDASERPVAVRLSGAPATFPRAVDMAPAASERPPESAGTLVAAAAPGVAPSRPPALEQPTVATDSDVGATPPTATPTLAVIPQGAATDILPNATPTVAEPPTTIAAGSGDLPSRASALAEPTPTPAAPGETIAAALFTLPAARGGEISLASYAGNKNVVLAFYRAFW